MLLYYKNLYVFHIFKMDLHMIKLKNNKKNFTFGHK